MSSFYDTAIVGAGLAGVCTALHLARWQRVLLLEAGDASGGASTAAAGLVNPFMARKARPVWRHREALDDLHATLDIADAVDLFDRAGVLRPADSTEQAGQFMATASEHPETEWLSHDLCKERFPSVTANHGALLVHAGGAVNIQRLLDKSKGVLAGLETDVHHNSRVTGLAEESFGVRIFTADFTEYHARQVVFTVGAGLWDIPGVPKLNLHRIKGQTVTIQRPKGLDDVTHLAGPGYIVAEETTLTIGSSYEHDFTDLAPNPDVTSQLLDDASRMLPMVRDCDVIAEAVGVRVTVPGTRLPMIGTLPGFHNVWVFTGLGSKGLLMAPMIARDIHDYLGGALMIPEEIRVRTAV